MTTLGWIFMCTSLLFVWGGAIWCYAQVLRAPTPGQGGD